LLTLHWTAHATVSANPDPERMEEGRHVAEGRTTLFCNFIRENQTLH
jgi:hypothetical protein